MKPFDADRVLPLALSLRNSPGCYVGVVGAGLSVASDIPAAWQVVEGLIRQVAAAHGEDPEDPETWYRSRYNKEPTYQDLLGELGPSPGDRHGLLRPLFARTPEDEPPTRQPNDGHVALARLAARGLVRVFVTTNFDLLIEDALRAEGLNPVTIATEHDWRSAPPLDTMQAAVVHIHGEWQRPDTLRNTEPELAGYPEWLQSLLSRSLDGRGYLIVGWSGRYDPALREALKDNRSGRYSTYWVDLAQPSEAGRELLVDLAGVVIEGGAADVLGTAVSTIDALAAESAVARGGAAVSVSRAKREIARGARPLDALDRLGEQVDAIASLPEVATLKFSTPDDNAAARERRVAILNACREAAALTLTLAALSPTDAPRWQEHIRWLGQPVIAGSGSTVLLAQHRLPGVVLLAAAGVGATAEENWPLVHQLVSGLYVPSTGTDGEEPFAVGVQVAFATSGKTSFSASDPMFIHAFSLLHAYLADVNREAAVLPATVFDEAWDRWEYIWSVARMTDDHALSSVPHLQVSGRSREYEPVNKGWFDRLRVAHGDALPLLQDAEAHTRFVREVTQIADRAAISTIRGTAGILPSGHWRVDETGEMKVPQAEQDDWRLFLR